MPSKNINELKNSGWEDMKLILNEEMPQKNERRVFFFWIFGIAGILLFTSLFYFNYHGTTNESKLNSVANDSPILKKQELNNHINYAEKNNVAIDINSVNKYGDEQTHKLSASKVSRLISSNSISKTKIFLSSGESSVPKSQIDKLNLELIPSSTQINEGQSINKNVIFTLTIRKSYITLAENLKMNLEVNPILRPKILPKPKHPETTFAGIGIVYNAFNLNPSLKLGGLFNYKLSNNFFIGSGLNLDYSHGNYLISPRSNIVSVVNIIDSSKSFRIEAKSEAEDLLNNSLGNSDRVVLTNYLLHINVPLTFNYQLSRTFSLGLGTEFSLLLNRLKNGNDNQTKYLLNLDQSASDISKFNAVNCGIHFNLTYYPTNRLSIQAIVNSRLDAFSAVYTKDVITSAPPTYLGITENRNNLAYGLTLHWRVK
ncbi:MAG: hypothetical protein ABI851_02290 [Saprospiraceae bacterium]